MNVVLNTVLKTTDTTVVVHEDLSSCFYKYVHCHKELQFTLIIKGQGKLVIGNYIQNFQDGEMYIIGPNQAHQFRLNTSTVEPERNRMVHAIHIFLDLEDHLKYLFNFPEMDGVREFLTNIPVGFQLPSKYEAEVGRLLIKVHRSAGLKRLLGCIKLLEFLSKKVRGWKNLSAGFTDVALAINKDLRIQAVFQYTSQHFTENITIETIASQANMTPHAFCKYFRKHTNKTYNAFLNEIRINEACKRIIKNDSSAIASIAYETGFNSAVNFNKVFKKITGKTPSEYRKEFKHTMLKSVGTFEATKTSTQPLHYV